MTRSSYRRAYGRRTSRVRALWVVASPLAIHTGHMTGATTVTTFGQLARGGFSDRPRLHIHNGPAGANAGISADVGLASGEMVITNGSGSITKNGINVPSDRADAIFSNPTGHSFNVHTALNPEGAMRGQLSAPR